MAFFCLEILNCHQDALQTDGQTDGRTDGGPYGQMDALVETRIGSRTDTQNQ